ncbi:Uma2 family endonuclease [Desulfobacterales bacterium HSG17]|nr:Uma2 family endonuclease [Desulfobacterales bacterium HSG17]
MGKALIKKSYYTGEEYLALEQEADSKSEFYNGELFAMAGGSRNHSVICVNMLWGIREAVASKNCTAFDSNMKLDIPKENSFVYPDAMVVCGDIEFSGDRTDIIKNPLLIIEILSTGTQAFDRGDKFKFYRSIPSFQEYILISQDEPMVETYYKQDPKTWIYTIVKGLDEMVLLRALEYELSMKDIYQKTDLKQEKS